MEKIHNRVFVIIPYLKTSEKIYIRGIAFRDSEDINDLPQDIQNHLKLLFSLFYLRDDLKIHRMSYAYLEYTDKNKDAVFTALYQARTVIAYLYGHPQHVGNLFLSFEHASFYLFWTSQIFKSHIANEYGFQNYNSKNIENTSNEDDIFIPSYDVLSNWNSSFSIIEGCRIYPEKRDFGLNISQNMAHDFHYQLSSEFNPHNWALETLARSEPTANEHEQRLLLAMHWYNQSNMHNQSELAALLHLAIAFECLFNLEEGEKITNRFKETIITLLGPIPRIDKWLVQFYNARSAIVHDGTAKIVFNPPISQKDTRSHRSLTAYGHIIFRLCLNAILSGATMAHNSGLASMFVDNQERLERICKKLASPDKSPNERILSIAEEVIELQEYWIESREINPNTLAGLAKLLIDTFLATLISTPPDVRKSMEEIVKPGLDTDKKLEEIKNIHSAVTDWKGQLPGVRGIPDDIFLITWILIDYIYHTTPIHLRI